MTMPSFLKSIAIVLTLAFSPLTISTAQAAVKIGSYVGKWKPSTSYAAGDLITYSDKTFLSLAKNKAKDPIKNPKVWQVLGGVGADGVGVTGPIGSKGDAGLQGVQGLIGSKGDAGLQGLQGVQGLIGSKGDAGLQGLQGVQGLIGSKGDAGLQGLPGVQGLIGSKGDAGLQGLQGVQGLIGLTGSAGADSTVPGLRGIQGLAGAHAVDGQHIGDTLVWNGTAWVPVAAAPVFNLGDTGPDGGKVFYVDGSGQHGLEAQLTDAASGASLAWNAATGYSAAYNITTITTGYGCSTTNAQLTPHCWHLPTKTELEYLCEQRTVVGGFASDYYWSSTDYNSSSAVYVEHLDGCSQMSIPNPSPYYSPLVRAVRAF